MRVGRGAFHLGDLHAGHRRISGVRGRHRFEQRRQTSIGIFTLTMLVVSLGILVSYYLSYSSG